jgi:hypothetical protein
MIGYGPFQGCTNLIAITVDAANPYFSSMDGVLFDKSQALLIQYPGGKPGSYTVSDSVTALGSAAFADFGLTNVALGNSVTNVGDEGFNNTPVGNVAFYGCYGLTAILVSASNSAYSSVDGVLFDKSQGRLILCPCGKAGSYTVPSGVTNLANSAFNRCASLASVTIANGVTAIGDYSFDFCYSLTSITIPNSVINIGGLAFDSCMNLASVTLSTSITAISDSMFSFCLNLTNVTIPNSVTSIGNHAFLQCECLASVTIPNGVTNIGDEAFSYCYSLTSIRIPSSVTSLGFYEFAWSTILKAIIVDPLNLSYSSVDGILFDKRLTMLIACPWAKAGSFTVPSTVTNIETFGFIYCAGLTNIYFEGNAPSLGTSVFLGDTNTTAYYLAGTTGWGPTIGGIPAVLWNPQVPADASFGVRSNRFGFHITATSGLLIVVEACTNLHQPGQSRLVSGQHQHPQRWFILFQRSTVDELSQPFLPHPLAVTHSGGTIPFAAYRTVARQWDPVRWWR